MTNRPLRIAILGWARLSLQAREGSGYNLSASELAAGLALSGHEVHYLASGIRYSLLPGPRIRPVETWRRVECCELVNSPNCSPAACNFHNMPREIAHPGECRAILRWLDDRRAQVVHIHSLEGYPLDLIGAIRDSGRPVVVTPHNYWFVCPQVDLLHQEVRVCTDYDGGRRCDGCMTSKPYAVQRTARTAGQTLEALVGPQWADMARKAFYGAAKRLKGAGRPRRATTEPFAPDPELAQGFDPGGQGHDGRISRSFAQDPDELPQRPLGASPIDANEQFLSPGACTRHLAILDNSIYGRRRHAGIAALNRASLVTPPSDFLRRVHVTMGVEESLTRVVRLGQPHFDQINRRARRSPFYRTRPWDPRTATGPLRLAFFGVTRDNKGLDILIRAIGLLPRENRQRCQFLIRAGGGSDWPFRKRVAEFPEVQFAGGYDLLQLIGAGGEYDVGILPHIWFENSPLVLLEHLHAGKFVIASRLGGPPEWVVEPPAPQYNGLMFPAGVPEALATCVDRLVSGKVVLPSAAEIHEATPLLRSYPGHVAEVERIYLDLAPDSSTAHLR